MNTYGMASINSTTFNLSYYSQNHYPRGLRNVLVTFLKLHNLILNVLGYCGEIDPKIPFISGCVRVLSGVSICVVTLAVGDRDASKGMIIGRWYDEALLTGMAQIVRGVLTAALATHPYGWAVNASLDVLGTFYNLTHILNNMSIGSLGNPQLHVNAPHSDPRYPLPLQILHLA